MGAVKRRLALTEEQQAIVEAARRGESFKVAAFAGTGKTTSLTEAARALPNKNILYLVFNKAQQKAAETRFALLKEHDARLKIEPRTAHGIAWRLFGRARYAERLGRDEHEATRAWTSYLLRKRWVAQAPAEEQAKRVRAAIETVKHFLASACAEIGSEHLPEALPFDSEALLTIAKALWSKLEAPDNSSLPITHDVYLKAWQLSAPRLPWCDVVMYDEAQDATPAMLDIVRRQAQLQTMYVGDQHQQIYEFRGAVNALSSLDLPTYALTETWRFGPRIAAAANAILHAKKEALRLKPARQCADVTHLGYPETVDTILVRTNVGLVEQALRLADRKATFFIRGAVNHETGLAGNGFGEICGRLLAAYDLWQNKETKHPAFGLYRSWNALKEAAQEDGGEALRPFVRLVEQHTKQVPYVVSRLRDNSTSEEKQADVVLSTVHRFKGEEAERVVLASDFRKFSYRNKEFNRDVFDCGEANIAYVALTRAKKELWMGGACAAIEDSLEHAGIEHIFSAPAALPEPQPRKRKQAALCGERYRHAKFGIITVVGKSNGILHIRTEKGATKQIAEKYVDLVKI